MNRRTHSRRKIISTRGKKALRPVDLDLECDRSDTPPRLSGFEPLPQASNSNPSPKKVVFIDSRVDSMSIFLVRRCRKNEEKSRWVFRLSRNSTRHTMAVAPRYLGLVCIQSETPFFVMILDTYTAFTGTDYGTSNNNELDI